MLARSHEAKNRLSNSIDIVDHIIIHHSENSQPEILKMPCAFVVVCLSTIMTLTIQFDDKILCRTVEINNVRFNRVLTSKLQAAELATT